MSLEYPYLVGRPDEVLWLMYRGASEITTYVNADGETLVCSKYEDGRNPVWFKENIARHIVMVSQPGVCLFDKLYQTNMAQTKWDRI